MFHTDSVREECIGRYKETQEHERENWRVLGVNSC